MSYERDFRKTLGYTNQEKLKKFFKATDFQSINWEKVEKLNNRLKEIVINLNKAFSPDIQHSNISELHNKIDDAYRILKENNLFFQLTNQGRDPEDVYYNWMRGYIICELFIPTLATLFSVEEKEIKHIGKDDLSKLETFSRSATADLQFKTTDNKHIRLEIQAGYTGINDIKASKITEAIAKSKQGIKTYIVHIDVYNGKAAIIDISEPNTNNLTYTENSRFEGVKTLSIKPEWFKWKLTEPLVDLDTLIIKL